MYPFPVDEFLDCFFLKNYGFATVNILILAFGGGYGIARSHCMLIFNIEGR